MVGVSSTTVARYGPDGAKKVAQRLTDGDRTRVREMRARGVAVETIADAFGVSPQYVYRLVGPRGQPVGTAITDDDLWRGLGGGRG